MALGGSTAYAAERKTLICLPCGVDMRGFVGEVEGLCCCCVLRVIVIYAYFELISRLWRCSSAYELKVEHYGGISNLWPRVVFHADLDLCSS
jgi:hypothetical protein